MADLAPHQGNHKGCPYISWSGAGLQFLSRGIWGESFLRPGCRLRRDDGVTTQAGHYTKRNGNH